MKNVYLGVFFAFITLAFFNGCGSNTPFQRGKSTQSEDPTIIKKPVTESPVTPPAPTDEPKSTNLPTPTDTTTPTPTLEPTPTVSLNGTYFVNEILPLLEAKKINGTTKGCSFCHGNPAPTFEEAEKLVVLGHPEESVLFLKATGADGSNHRPIWTQDSPESLKLILWISGKAIF